MKKNVFPSMFERVKKCGFCSAEMEVSALAFAENPFCSRCLSERVNARRAQNTAVSWTLQGDYLVSTDLSQQKRQ